MTMGPFYSLFTGSIIIIRDTITVTFTNIDGTNLLSYQPNLWIYSGVAINLSVL